VAMVVQINGDGGYRIAWNGKGRELDMLRRKFCALRTAYGVMKELGSLEQ